MSGGGRSITYRPVRWAPWRAASRAATSTRDGAARGGVQVNQDVLQRHGGSSVAWRVCPRSKRSKASALPWTRPARSAPWRDGAVAHLTPLLQKWVPRAEPLVGVQGAKPPGGVGGNAPIGSHGLGRLLCGERDRLHAARRWRCGWRRSGRRFPRWRVPSERPAPSPRRTGAVGLPQHARGSVASTLTPAGPQPRRPGSTA